MKKLIWITLAVFIILAIMAWSTISYKHDDNKINEYPSLGSSELERVWEYKTPEIITSTPVWDGNGNIYLHTESTIMAIRETDGELLWSASSPSKTPLNPSPVIRDGYLIVPEDQSRIAVFSRNNGQLLWRSSIIDAAVDRLLTANIESIAATSEMLYVARFDWTITAYKLINGEIAWEDKLPGSTFPYVVADGRHVYVGVGPLLKVYDGIDGILLWEQGIFGYIGPMSYFDGILYILDEKNPAIFALDAASKNTLWKDYYEGIDAFEFGCITVNKDFIIIAAEEIILVSKNNRKPEWVSEKIGRLECPVMLDNKLYVRNANNLMFSLNISTGQIVGVQDLDFDYTPIKHEPNRGPLATDRLIILPINEYEVIAYKPKSNLKRPVWNSPIPGWHKKVV
ncbi:MAG TPA: hypothetical protein DIW27_06320 [Cytophagales bacterium]|nr:hypothetical protein [Cytophagales bacterium]